MSIFNNKDKKNDMPNPNEPADQTKTPPQDNLPKQDEDDNAVITVESLVTVNHNGIDHVKGAVWETTEQEARPLIDCGAVKKYETA